MLRSLLSWLLLLTALPSLPEPTGDLAEKLRVAVHAHDPAAQVATLERSPVRGLHLTYLGGVSGYVTADGRYFIVGDMLDLASRSNVTETQQQEKRRALLQKVTPEEAIVFGPAKPRHSLIVFTDVVCPYCRKLHGELGEFREERDCSEVHGVFEVGAGTKAWRTMAAVWCAKDRREALTRATRGEAVPVQGGSTCSDAVIAKHYALGQQLGIPGTPMIVLSDGTSLGGYMAPDKLVSALAEHGVTKNGTSEQ